MRLRLSKIAFVFPGQGSQYVGMGASLCQQYPEANEIFKQANSLLGKDIKSLCLNGPAEKLNWTINTQPAIFVLSCICFRLLERKGIQVTVTAGHSLGEYTALACARAFDITNGLKLVAERARLMEEASQENSGKMVAVLGLDSKSVESIIKSLQDRGVIGIANYNCPGQVVVSGENALVDETKALFEQAGAKRVIELGVSGAFHSSLMEKAATKFRICLEKTHFSEPRIPLVSNYTGESSTKAEELKAALKKQITGAVRWQKSVETMACEGVDYFIELGPGKVIKGLIKRTLPEAKVFNVEDSRTLEETAGFLQGG